jgi:hypothetical protein
VSDRDRRRRGEGELPPDPWAGLAGPPRTPPPPPTPPSSEAPWAAGGRPARPPGWERHPSVSAGDGGPTPSRRTVWHHPAVWIAVLALAGLLLLGALLEGPSRTTPEPAPETVSTFVEPGTTSLAPASLAAARP